MNTQSNWPTGMTSVNLVERYLEFSERSKNTMELAERLLNCNLGFTYQKAYDPATKKSLIADSNVFAAGKDGDLIDYAVLECILNNVDNQGFNFVKNDLQVVGAAMFQEIFNLEQRTNYILYGRTKLKSDVRALTNSFLPSLVLMPGLDDDRMGYSGLVTRKAVTNGIMPTTGGVRDAGLYLPVDKTYNMFRLQGPSVRGGVTELMPVFMIIGPGNELLTGSNLGYSRRPKEQALLPSELIKTRLLSDGTKVYDQKLTSCFYIGQVGERIHSVLRTMQSHCARVSKAVLNAFDRRDIAVIKIGYIPHLDPHGFDDDGETLRITNFIFKPDLKWTIGSYLPDKTIFENTVSVIRSNKKEPDTEQYAILTRNNTAQIYSNDMHMEEQEAEPAGTIGTNNFNLKRSRADDDDEDEFAEETMTAFSSTMTPVTDVKVTETQYKKAGKGKGPGKKSKSGQQSAPDSNSS